MSPGTPKSDGAPLEPGGLVTEDSFDGAARARLSGPGLRTFLNIAALWQLSERERLLLLGSPARSTYHNWVAKAQAGTRITLPLDTLLRISAVLGIHKALRILFADSTRALQWLRSENAAPLFGGQRPIDLLLSGTQVGPLELRRFLDAWRGGVFATPIEHPIEDEAWDDDAIEIVDG